MSGTSSSEGGWPSGWLIAAGAGFIGAILARWLGDASVGTAIMFGLVVFLVFGVLLGMFWAVPAASGGHGGHDSHGHGHGASGHDSHGHAADSVTHAHSPVTTPVSTAAPQGQAGAANSVAPMGDAARSSETVPKAAMAAHTPVPEAVVEEAASVASVASATAATPVSGAGSASSADAASVAEAQSVGGAGAASEAEAATVPSAASVSQPTSEAEAASGAGTASGASLMSASGAASDTGPATDLPAESAATSAGSEVRPTGLAAPRDGKGDDLQVLEGIGPAMEKLCHGLGIFHFDQIAAWGPTEIAWMDSNLKGFRGRVTRDKWVRQAQLIGEVGVEEFKRRAKTNDY